MTVICTALLITAILILNCTHLCQRRGTIREMAWGVKTLSSISALGPQKIRALVKLECVRGNIMIINVYVNLRDKPCRVCVLKPQHQSFSWNSLTKKLTLKNLELRPFGSQRTFMYLSLENEIGTQSYYQVKPEKNQNLLRQSLKFLLPISAFVW